MNITPKLENAIEKFVKLLNERAKRVDGDAYYVYKEYSRGKRFVKIVFGLATDKRFVQDLGVYCFIDGNGDIYKAESFYRAAKHVRGNIYNENPLQGTDIYSPKYLR